MRTWPIVVAATLVSASVVYAGPADHPAKPQLQLRVADGATAAEGTIFGYTIIHPENVRAAWIEVLDRPVLLDRKEIKVQAIGEIAWAWDDTGMGYPTEAGDDLSISIWDPHGETTTCDVNTVMTTSRDGGLVSRRTIGSRGRFAPAEIGLDPLFLRVPQDQGQLTIAVLGTNLTPGAKFTVKPLEGAACEDSAVRVETLDLSHARITVAGDCFRKSGAITLSPAGAPDYYAPIQIFVASRRSPVLQSVTPILDRSNPAQPQLLALTLRGRGFNKESDIYIGYGPGPGALQQMPQLLASTVYVSPTELRAELKPEDQDLIRLLERVSWIAGLDLRVWVEGSGDRHELSDFRDVSFEEARALVRPKTALITSVSPYPIKPMNEHSPEELALTIRGENFLPEDKVVLDFGHFGPHEQEVRSQYVSPTMLRAWVPRKLWRKQQITYRLVVEAIDGQHYSFHVNAPSEEN